MPSMIALGLLASTLALDAPAPPDDWVEPWVYELGVPPMSCDTDMDCAMYPGFPYCNPEILECAVCATNDHCDPGWACTSGFCQDICTTDEECDGVNGEDTCHVEYGLCVQCLDASGCDEAQYCMNELCMDDHCTPGETLCFGATVMLCGEDGGTTEVQERCPDACAVIDGIAQCTEPGGFPTTGSADTGQGHSTGPGLDTGGGTLGPGTNGATDSDGAGGSGATSTAGNGGAVPRDGCACSSGTPRGSTAWAWWGLMGLGAVRRRRR